MGHGGDVGGRNASKRAALEAYSAKVSVIDMDVANDESVAAGFATILDEGPVDVLINNAGIMYLGITEAFSVAQAAAICATTREWPAPNPLARGSAAARARLAARPTTDRRTIARY